jgi:hypothetical protein
MLELGAPSAAYFSITDLRLRRGLLEKARAVPPPLQLLSDMLAPFLTRTSGQVCRTPDELSPCHRPISAMTSGDFQRTESADYVTRDLVVNTKQAILGEPVPLATLARYGRLVPIQSPKAKKKTPLLPLAFPLYLFLSEHLFSPFGVHKRHYAFHPLLSLYPAIFAAVEIGCS